MTDAWRADAAAWWASPEWHAYEIAYGDESGARTRLLATAPWQTRILDLTPEPNVLWTEMRKGRRAEIRVAEREYGTSVGREFWQWDAYASTHGQVHGWPRPVATYGEQACWLKSEHGLVALTLAAPKVPGVQTVCAAAYFIRFGGWGYYASSASVVPDTLALALWRGVLALREAGVTTLELGWQGHATDEKGQAVEHYKRGFGGVDVPARLP